MISQEPEAAEVAHAQKYRRWQVATLIEELSHWSESEVFPNPITGNLCVVDADGNWLAILQPGERAIAP
jgi:hypothetical protein